MTVSLAQLLAPRTEDELFAQLVQALKGIGFVRQSGSGTGTVLATGIAQGNFAVVLEVTKTGEIGTAEYRWSLDGGEKWSDSALIPRAPTPLAATGAVLAFAPGATDAGDSFVALDRYSFYVGIPTFGQTAWQQFSWQRRILELEAEAGGDVGALVSAIATGGYLADAQGAWLDLYCDNVYDERRNPAVQAKGVCVLTDAGAGGPYAIAAGQLWAATADGALRFVNTTAGSLPESGTLALEFAAESPGVAFNVGIGAITQLITPLPGVTVANPAVGSSGSWLTQAGVDEETDDALRTRCRKKWASLAIGRTNAGFEFWALEASDQVTRAFARQSETVPGQVELFVAGAGGAVPAKIVAVVDAYVQPRVPLTTSCVTASAMPVQVRLGGRVFVKAGMRGQAEAAAMAALAEYIAAVPIGGEKVAKAGIVSREVLIACLARGSRTSRVDGVVDVALGAPRTDVALTATQVPVLDVGRLAWVEV